jgi:hypothetical protein
VTIKPAVLHAELSAACGYGQQAAWDPKQLTNRFDAPFAVNSIVFTLISTNSALADPAPFAKVRIYAGAFELTRGWIPLGCLCPTIDRAAENLMSGAPEQFVWELPKPLIVPPNTAVTAQIQIDPGVASSNWTGGVAGITAASSVALVGMVDIGTKFDLNKRVAIPYAACWLSDATSVQDNSAATLSAQRSKSSDLVNPFNDVLFVKNLVSANFWGAAQFVLGTATPQVSQDGIITAMGSITNVTNWSTTPTYQIYRSGPLGVSGLAAESKPGTNYVMPLYAPGKALFSHATREWRMNAALAPREFFQINAQLKMNGPGTGYLSKFQHRIGMTGYALVPASTIWHR